MSKKITLGRADKLTLSVASNSGWIDLNNTRTGSYPIALFIEATAASTAFDCTVEYTWAVVSDSAVASEIREHKYLKNLTEASLPEDLDGGFAVPVSAIRLKLNSITGGEVSLSIIQPGV